MRDKLLPITLGCAASAALAAAALFQPLNVKTGLWELTKAVTWTDVPPQMAPMMRATPTTTTDVRGRC